MQVYVVMYYRMQNYFQFIIPRLNGGEIRKKFGYYLSLVRKGIAGFIIFGGELEKVREGIKRLQDEAELPLIIASDLEQGLGQQINGGTLFPPSMAVASAIKKTSYEMQVASSVVAGQALALLRKTYKSIAAEARYTGINTIFAPVLDINTNPRNPIISVRAFGEDSNTVSFFGCEMINAIQGYRLAACGKHFPGHGDTESDSHIILPSINLSLKNLKKCELQPFEMAIKAGVKMIMLGHLNVPAIDPAGIPVSISEKAVRFLRHKMKFDGMIITDALNMGGIGKYSEEEAAFKALRAGVNLLLHPTDHEKIVSYLRTKNVLFNTDFLTRFRRGLIRNPSADRPVFDRHRQISKELTEKAIEISGDFEIKGTLHIVILNDEKDEKGGVFLNILKKKFPSLKSHIINRSSKIQKIDLPDKAFVIVAIFSETKAWKGGASSWLKRNLSNLKHRTDLFVSFGSKYLLDDIEGAAKLYVFWDSVSSQKVAARVICRRRF